LEPDDDLMKYLTTDNEHGDQEDRREGEVEPDLDQAKRGARRLNWASSNR
jgi:hypothetical protein